MHHEAQSTGINKVALTTPGAVAATMIDWRVRSLHSDVFDGGGILDTFGYPSRANRVWHHFRLDSLTPAD